jgi:hypothetical protein
MTKSNMSAMYTLKILASPSLVMTKSNVVSTLPQRFVPSSSRTCGEPCRGIVFVCGQEDDDRGGSETTMTKTMSRMRKTKDSLDVVDEGVRVCINSPSTTARATTKAMTTWETKTHTRF